MIFDVYDFEVKLSVMVMDGNGKDQNTCYMSLTNDYKWGFMWEKEEKAKTVRVENGRKQGWF